MTCYNVYMTTTMKTITIRMPGTVWEDFLDPLASSMQAELELPAMRRVKRGRGWTAVYEDVSEDVARETMRYLQERGDTLLGNSDPEFDSRERGVYRKAIAVAEKIYEDLRG